MPRALAFVRYALRKRDRLSVESGYVSVFPFSPFSPGRRTWYSRVSLFHAMSALINLWFKTDIQHRFSLVRISTI